MRRGHLRRNPLAQCGLTDCRGLLVSAALSALDGAARMAGRPGHDRSQGGDVAQLGERLVRNEEVVGSIPIISTTSSTMSPILGQAQRNPDL